MTTRTVTTQAAEAGVALPEVRHVVFVGWWK